MDKVEIQRVHVRDGIASKAQKSTVLVSFSLKAAMADAIKRTVHRYSNDDRSYK